MRYGKPWILLLTLALFLTAVLFWQQEPAVQFQTDMGKPPISVQVYGNGRSEQIDGWEDGTGRCYVFLPAFAELSQTELKLEEGSRVSVNGQRLVNGQTCENFQLEETYPLEYSCDGEICRSSLIFLRSAKLSSVHIRVQSGNMAYIHREKGNEESGTIHIYGADGTASYVGNLKSISGRGNGTWTSEKKSYSLSLAGDGDLLEMGSAQRWILLANDGDPSHLRNKLVYDYALDAGLNYSPESRWVDLYLNGEYVGLYQLCERNEIHPQRVALEESNSFLVSLELEKRLAEQEIPYICTDSGRALRIHHSSLADGELKQLWQSAENAILAENGTDPITGKSWLELIDLDSWARKYLVEELFGNGDAGGLSQFFYCDTETGKILAGPVWDFDISMGSSGVWQQMQPQAFFANRERLYRGMESSWYQALWEKEAFSQRVIQLYRDEFRPLLVTYLRSTLPEYAAHIQTAAQLNRCRWNRDSAQEATAKIQEYMPERMAFLDSVWLENETWHRVLVDINDGSNIACYAVRPGDTLPQLPDITAFPDAIGWYDRKTEQPVDLSAPVTGDLDIYCKRETWEDADWENSGNGEPPYLKVSLKVFLALFLAAAGWESIRQTAAFRAGKRKEMKKHQN